MTTIEAADYTLHLGDCLDVMATMPDACIDLTVTSPPYDNLRTYGKDFDPDKFDWRPIIKELYRITKPGGVVVWVVADATINGSETGTSFRQALWAMDCGFCLYDTMIWDKGRLIAPTEKRYYSIFEYMFVLSKNKPKSINLICDRENKTHGKTERKHKRIGSENRAEKNEHYVTKKHGRRFNLWTINENPSKFKCLGFHPAPFPEALANDHIISWSNPGDTVFDPMMGSGTTGKMAMMNGRKFIGIELDADYFAIAEKRVHEAANPLQPALMEAAD